MPDRLDDDEDWLDELAGRASAGSATTRTEAAWLRAALARFHEAVPMGSVPEPVPRLDALLDKATARGLLNPRTPGATVAPAPVGRAGRPRLLDRIAGAWRAHGSCSSRLVATAATVVLAVGLLVIQPWTDDGSSLRGGPVVQQVVTPDPEARRDQVRERLRAVGLESRPFTRLGRAGLEVELPPALSREQGRALRDLGVVAPDGPMLVLQFVEP